MGGKSLADSIHLAPLLLYDRDHVCSWVTSANIQSPDLQKLIYLLPLLAFANNTQTSLETMIGIPLYYDNRR
jgi:hypothetical protein